MRLQGIYCSQRQKLLSKFLGVSVRCYDLHGRQLDSVQLTANSGKSAHSSQSDSNTWQQTERRSSAQRRKLHVHIESCNKAKLLEARQPNAWRRPNRLLLLLLNLAVLSLQGMR